jgi:pimeloyl-ACP methyl ester carboxylesterase
VRLRHRARSLLLAAVAVTAATASCTAGSSTSPVSGSTEVSFTTSDGVRLAGRLFGPEHASAGVVLTHMLPADQSSWYPEAAHLAAQGYRVLTFDLRGYCPGGDGGCSQGTKDLDAAPIDLTAALTFLRANGPSRIALVGASVGGIASLIVASRETDIAAVVALSAPQVIDSLSAGTEVLANIGGAKLFIAGLGDPAGAAQAAEALDAQSPDPKRMEIVTTDDHGIDLLTGGQGTHVTQLIDAWLSQYLHPSGAS